MNIGQTSPFTGLIKYFPMNMPRFSFSAEVLSISDSHLTSSMNFFTSLSYSVPLTNSLTRGCSGANTRYVTPKIVSGLVVNVEISKSESLTLKNISRLRILIWRFQHLQIRILNLEKYFNSPALSYPVL